VIAVATITKSMTYSMMLWAFLFADNLNIMILPTKA